jgi:DNA repair protein RecO (recombination protein O)
VRINLQPAYLLHRQAYRDSSQLLEIFTPEHGRLSLVARGVRRKARGGSTGAILQPFVPLLVSFSGRAEMKTLTSAEVAKGAVTLRGERLFSGLYLNELLVRLLHRHDPHPRLFARYAQTLQDLGAVGAVGAAGAAGSVDETLRRFELGLLDELGYNIDLESEAQGGEALHPGQWYRYEAGSGLVRSVADNRSEMPVFPGEDLLALSQGEFNVSSRKTAKRLMRLVLAEHLGGKPLHSRDLFSQYSTSSSPSCTS